MKEQLRLTETFDASAETIYNAWLDGQKHAEMTGGDAECQPEEGTKFTAWDGYIWGTNTSLTPNKEIVQTWRTTEFEEEDEDSHLKVQLKDIDGGCEVTLIHTNIPEGQTQYEQGWVDHYFEPMKEYFNN